MKNKNDITTNQLIDTILEMNKLKGNEPSSCYAYALGVLQSLLNDAARNDKKVQESINRSFEWVSEDLQLAKLKQMEAVCNSSKLEELYAWGFLEKPLYWLYEN